MNAKSFCLACLSLLWFPLSSFPQDTPNLRLLRASLVQGDVTYQRTDLDKWVDMSVNTPVLEGDRVWVGRDGRAEIEFEDLSYVRLADNTVVEFVHIGENGSLSPTYIRVNRGLASFEISAEDGPMTIETPLFSIVVRKPVKLRVDVDPDGYARVVVFSGETEVQNQTTSLFLRDGETLRFLSSDPGRYYLGTDYEQDEWDRWNFERSDYLARLIRERHYTESPDWNSGELDTYGTWYDVPTYGQVWRPYGAVDWAPFRQGRWVWYDSFGWTWVSYEPWGWIPYHYGRWSFVASYGWCWVPGRHGGRWCPGAVSWIQGPNWVGWVPLAPREPWYSNHYRPRTSVNVFVSQNYRHRDVITYLPQDGFLNGTPQRDFRRPVDPLREGRVVFGQPSLTPTALSRMPVVQAMTTRRYNNDDLETRRNLREQVVTGNTAGQSPAPAITGPLEQRSVQREQITGRDSRIETIGKTASSESGVRVIQGGNNREETSNRLENVRSYDTLRSAGEGLRTEQRQNLDRKVERIGADNAPKSQVETRDDRVQREGVNSAPARTYSTPTPRSQQSQREDSRQVIRDRTDSNSDRYSVRPQGESATPRSSESGRTYNFYNPPSRVESPTSRSEPRYETRPMSSSSSSGNMSSGPASASRESPSRAQTETRSGGASSQENRGTARARTER